MDFCDNQHYATNSVDWVWLVPNPEYSLNMFMKISANKRVVFNSAVLCECVEGAQATSTPQHRSALLMWQPVKVKEGKLESVITT